MYLSVETVGSFDAFQCSILIALFLSSSFIVMFLWLTHTLIDFEENSEDFDWIM